jgi:hypothetical protein
MSSLKVIAEIQAYSDSTGHYVRFMVDGHEIERWGPCASQAEASTYATKAAETLRAAIAAVEDKP